VYKPLFILLSLNLVGCATADGYRDFYTAVPGATPERIAEMRAAPPPPDPKVVHLAGRFDQNAQREYAKEGFEVIGYASFTGGRRPDEDAAVDQAQKICLACDLTVSWVIPKDRAMPLFDIPRAIS